MEERGMHQAELARAMHVSRQHVRELLREEYNYTIRLVIRLVSPAEAAPGIPVELLPEVRALLGRGASEPKRTHQKPKGETGARRRAVANRRAGAVT
ncbi:MAG TPA: helix-turn-helix transcriptional regulator [Candidatus Sumerlaeota bacterium]|nr:helix-turn-helix transcriptional regulator [Candidatus Sumerlaeota bacterium]HOR28508.1 helix-turn-helix transcriptional regulator [Candidatus Sumerlaeota bacterium]